MASANDFNFVELVTPAELKILAAKESGIFFTQEVTGEGEKKNSKDKKKLCVSNKRIYILNIQGKTPKLDLSLSLLAINGLSSPSPDIITLGYTIDPHSDKTKQTKLEVKSELCVDSLAAILSPLHSSLGRDAVARRLKVKIHGEGRLDKMDTIVDENVARVTQNSQVGAVSELYALLCDYLDIPFHDEIAWDLENTYHTHSIRTLSLNDFSYFSTRDLVPLIRALEFTPRFEGLFADGIKLCSDSLDALLSISKSCPSLRNLTLRSIPGLSYKQIQKLFSQGFAANQLCTLESIDLTDTVVEDKGVEAVAAALLSFPVAPRELKLSGTGFSSKGYASLSKNLLKHPDTCNSLRVLDLSGNHFSSASDLQTFFSLLAATNRIQELSLANTNASFDQLFAALHKGCLSHLSSLDLSGNSKPAVGKSQSKSASVKQFLQSSLSLKRLNLSACKLPSDLVLQVLESLGENTNLSSLHLNLSQNDLSACFKETAEMLSELECVSSLDLSQTGLDANYSDVISHILNNRSLLTLDLSGNMKRFKAAAAKALQASLSDTDCSLHSLKLRDCRLGDHMHFVLRALIRNGALKQLDVSANQMGPPSFRQLAKLISNNCSLESILFDENSASVGCISGLASALENNFSICEMPIPYKDMPRLRKEGDKELETALAKVSRLLARNQSPLKREHALAVIRKRVQLFLAEHQLSLDKKIVQLEEEIQLYDRGQLDEGKKEILDRATQLAAKAGLVTMLCENFYTDKLETETSAKLSALVSSISSQSMVPELRGLRQKLVDEMLDKLDFSLGNVISKEKLEEVRESVSDLQPPSFLTEDLLSVFSGGLASGVNAGNLGLAEQLISRTCELVSAELDTMHQQVCKLESAESPKSPDRSASGGTCRMKLAFSQSMKRHRVSYQTFNPQFDTDALSEDLDETQPTGDVPGEGELPVPTILETKPSLDLLDDTPPLEAEDPQPESAVGKSSSIRAKFRGFSKKVKAGTKIARTGSNSSVSSLKAEPADLVPDLTAFEDLSSAATRAPELDLLKSKPKGPIRRPPKREQREPATEAPLSDLFSEIAATVVPGLEQEATPVPDEPTANESEELTLESKEPFSAERPTSPEEKQDVSEEATEKRQAPPPSPRKVPSGQTTPGAGGPGLASVLMAGLGKSRLRPSKSQENIIAAAEKEDLQQKKSLDFLSKDMTQLPIQLKPKPRGPRPASMIKPALSGAVTDAKEGEEMKLPPIATKRHTMEDKPTKLELSKEETVVISSNEESLAKCIEESVDKAEKKEIESHVTIPVAPGVDGDLKKSPSISRKPLLPKPKDKPVVDSKVKDAKNEGGESEVKRPPVALNRPKPTTIKPQKPLPSKAKPKLSQESAEKVAVENTDASEVPDKTKRSESQPEEEKDKIKKTKPESLELSNEQVGPLAAAQPLVESSDTSTTSSDLFEDACDKSAVGLVGRSQSASSPFKAAVKPGPQTPTKPKRMTFGGKSQSSEEGTDVTSPKIKSPLTSPKIKSPLTSPKIKSPLLPPMTSPTFKQPTQDPREEGSASDSKEIAEKSSEQSTAEQTEATEDTKGSDNWVLISDDEGDKADRKNEAQTGEIASSDN